MRIANVLLACVLVTSVVRADALEEGFKSPPNSARVQCWWHWMNGNVSREGITKDLEAMKADGIGGFTAFSVLDQIPPGPVGYMDKEWLGLMEHAVRESDRLGLEMCMHNCAGWSSSGGPWISAEQSMQEIFFTETEVKGGQRVQVKLPRPQTKRDFYRDIIVVAFPKVAEFKLKDWEWKRDANTQGRKPDSQIVRDDREAPADAVVKSNDVKVLKGAMDAEGNLAWDAPAGDWIVVRFGHTTTGRVCKPAPKAGEGLECDKLSRAAVKHHWDHSVQRVIDRAGPLAGKAFDNVLIDSYEVGFTNWTQGLDAIFSQRLGYEMTKFWPCMTGRVVDSVDTSERFLWDFRRLIADLMAENYFGYFGELCHERGMKLSIEPYGPGGFDDFQIAGLADVPMGEFWVERADAWHLWSSKVASSAAHARGISIVGAESFTANPGGAAFKQHPYTLKTLGDEFFAQGISRYIFHTNVHQPWADDVLPGMTMGPHGIQFNRNNTWRKHARPWLDALARTQFMLQQGHMAADLCYLAAEDAPQTPLNRAAMNPVPPAGYDYDVLHYGFVMQMKVMDGQLKLPSGMTYRVLVLPDTERMRPELLAKVVELSKAGAKVFVPRKIVASPSLQGASSSDAKVQALAAELPMAGKLAELLPVRDFEVASEAPVVYLHRKAEGGDVYFVANQEKKEIAFEAVFRAGGDAEIWQTSDARVEKAAAKRESDCRTRVALKLGPAESVFVVFRAKSNAPAATEVQFAREQAVDQPWTLRFPAGWGAPESVEVPKLASWSENENPEIKHFSGTATYTTKLKADAVPTGERAVLDLGDVQVLAEVKVNGKSLGLLWKPPFRVDVTDALKARENEIEVSVTNLWANRLIGDAQYPLLAEYKTTGRGRGIVEIPGWLLKGVAKPETKRKTFTTWDFFKKDDPLQPAGLIGPVKLKFGRTVEVAAPK